MSVCRLISANAGIMLEISCIYGANGLWRRLVDVDQLVLVMRATTRMAPRLREWRIRWAGDCGMGWGGVPSRGNRANALVRSIAPRVLVSRAG